MNAGYILGGEFGAVMQVHIQNDGPITLQFETPNIPKPKEVCFEGSGHIGLSTVFPQRKPPKPSSKNPKPSSDVGADIATATGELKIDESAQSQQYFF